MNNEIKVDIELFNYLTPKFSKKWSLRKVNNIHIQDILKNASKSLTKKRGEPDLIYLNEENNLLILIENKDKIKNHISNNQNNPKDYAVDGIKHYLSFFINNNNIKETTKKYISNLKIIGIAFSGDINDKYNHKISTFIIDNNNIKNMNIEEFLDEDDYLSIFENLDLEKITDNISKSSKKINQLLRNIDSQKRPVLLSALMICLYETDKFSSSFRRNYLNFDNEDIIENIPVSVKKVLSNEEIDRDKIEVLLNEITFLKTDKDLKDTSILKEILIELENNVLPLFNKKSSYDIIGKFYEEFLRYAGISNVKKGIVLTPHHITDLFTKLIPLKINDIILDPACGSGAFLISGMNNLVDIIKNSTIEDKNNKIQNIKTDQLLGFEKSTTMYSLAISNMLFRGDGKSKIFNIDFFSKEADEIIKDIKPTIGFINPPYGGKDNKSNPTKKEIQFLEKLLDSVGRYVVIIAPLSTYFKDDNIRERILKKHTLKYVINMPNELFMPNASTHTAIAVFETNLPHNNKKVVLYDLKDDGFVLSKNKGRTDIYNKWDKIEKDLLDKINNPEKYNDNINLVYKNIQNDEWILQAHIKTDYSKLSKNDFILKLKEYIIFDIKKRFNLLDKKIDELTFMEILQQNNITSKSIIKTDLELDIDSWKEYKIIDLFDVKGTKTTPITKLVEYGEGIYPYVTTRASNNGVDGFFNYWTEKGNVLVVDSATIGHTTYQELNFSASDHVEKLLPKFNLNRYIALFLVTILNKEQFRYSYGRKFNQNRIKNTIIKLPTKNNTPNWGFMEEYIKSLPYSNNL